MTDYVYKSVEITGTSTDGVTEAIDRAVAKASETLRNLDWFEVVNVRGHIEEGRVAHYQVTLKIGFRLDERLLARLVLERDREADPEVDGAAVADRDVLTDHLGDPQVADRLRRRLDGVARGGLPRFGAHPDHLGDAVDAVGHANPLLEDADRARVLSPERRTEPRDRGLDVRRVDVVGGVGLVVLDGQSAGLELLARGAGEA